MLVAIEAGSLLRGLFLLLSFPIIVIAYIFISEALAIKMLILISFSGLKVRDIELASRAVLPRFYAADVRSDSFDVFDRCQRKVIVTANPTVMVDAFVKEYLGGEKVLGTEIEVNPKTMKATGFVKEPGVLVGKWKKLAILKEFGDDSPDIGIGDRKSDHDFMSVCKLRGRVGRSNKEAHAHLFYPNKLLLTPAAKKRLEALEECGDLGQGLQLAERDMTIRGFGNIFGVQQTGDIGNVGIDLFFEMLFESLSMVDVHRTRPVSYKSVKLELDINPRLSSEYVNYLDNPIEVVKDAEKAAEKDTWSLVQFTVELRREYGKEPYAMEALLKKLYVKRMAADIGITRIYVTGKTVVMMTNMSQEVFKMITDAMFSDTHRNMLAFESGEIKAELLIDLPKDQLLTWIFQLLAELHSALPALIRY